MTTTHFMDESRKIWTQILSTLEQRISQAHFRTWFNHTTLTQTPTGTYRIGVPNMYAKEVVTKRYASTIGNLLKDFFGQEVVLEIAVDASPVGLTKRRAQPEPLFGIQAPTTSNSKKTSLRGDFTFTSFAVSTSNQLAHAATTAASKMPGKAYNPLFIYGGVGVGKTHLMHAAGHAIMEQKPEARILYCTGEEFTNELIAAIQTKTTNAFKKRYREADCLLIDDIQFIAGKTTIQEEFFHTFNAVHRAGSQIILTSDRPPSEIARLEERLLSRFEAGMIVDISPPDFELKTAILLIKAKNLGVALSMPVAQTIAERASDIRRMEGMFTRLIAISSLENSPITDELAQRLFGAPSQENKRIIQPKSVVEGVANHYNIRVSQLKGAKRDRAIARPRQVAMYLLREDLRLSLTEVGRFLGGRDHTTILYGVEKVTQLLGSDQTISLDIAGIRKSVWG